MLRLPLEYHDAGVGGVHYGSHEEGELPQRSLFVARIKRLLLHRQLILSSFLEDIYYLIYCRSSYIDIAPPFRCTSRSSRDLCLPFVGMVVPGVPKSLFNIDEDFLTAVLGTTQTRVIIQRPPAAVEPSCRTSRPLLFISNLLDRSHTPLLSTTLRLSRTASGLLALPNLLLSSRN